MGGRLRGESVEGGKGLGSVRKGGFGNALSAKADGHECLHGAGQTTEICSCILLVTFRTGEWTHPTAERHKIDPHVTFCRNIAKLENVVCVYILCRFCVANRVEIVVCA